MATGHQGPSSTRRHRLIGAALLLWLAVVVIGAGADADDSLLGVERIEVVWVIALGLMVLFGVVLLILLNPFGSEWVEPDRQRSRGSWLFLFAVVVLLTWKPDLIPNFRDEEEAESESAEAQEAPETIVEDAQETVAELTDLLLVLVVALAIAGVVVLLRVRAAADEPDAEEQELVDEALEADLAEALEQLTAELELGTDPRSSVLTAYAILESVLANHGTKRARSETPTEHLRRSLARLRIDAEPLVQLGDLYELARFSDRPITSADQQDALRSLARARTELARLS